MQGSSRVAAQLVASRVVVSNTELVRYSITVYTAYAAVRVPSEVYVSEGWNSQW
jgi:hypothetical protein